MPKNSQEHIDVYNNRHRRRQHRYIVPCVGDLNVCRFLSVENVAFAGWVQGFATFFVDSLKGVLSGVCGLRDDPETIEKIDYKKTLLPVPPTNLLNTSIYFTYMLTMF